MKPFKVLPVALLGVAVAVLLLSLAAAADPGGEDASDELSTATGLEAGTHAGSMLKNETEDDPADFYAFAFEPGALVTINATLGAESTTSQEVHFQVYDLEGMEVVQFTFPRPGTKVTFAALTSDLVADTEYRFGLTWDGSNLVDYSLFYVLELSAVGGPQDDAGLGADAASDRPDAASIGLGEHHGTVGGADSLWERDGNSDMVDYYRVTPEEGLFLRLDILMVNRTDSRERDLVLSLENATGKVLGSTSLSGPGDSDWLLHYPKDGSALYVNVSSSSVMVNYTLKLSTQVPGADAGKPADAGEDADHAMGVDEGSTDGHIMRGMGAEDARDFFEFQLDAGAFFEASVTLRTGTASPSNVLFSIYDHTKSQVVNFSYSALDQPRRFAALTNSRYPTLRYYMAVSWTGDDDVNFEFRYELRVTIGPSQDDVGPDRDVEGTLTRAYSLDLDTQVSGSIGGSSPQWGTDENVDGRDAYEVFPSSNSFLVVRATLQEFYGQRRVGFDVQLMDPEGNVLALQSVFAEGQGLEVRVFVPSSRPMYAVVVSESEMCNYTLIAITEAPPSIDLFVMNITLTPSKVEPKRPLTITVEVGASALVVPAAVIRVELYADGNKLDHKDVILDNTDRVVASFSWVGPSTDTELRVVVDALDSIPYETDEENNQRTLRVVLEEDPDGDDGEGTSMLMWILILVVVLIVVIVAAVAIAFLRGGHDEEEGPEDY